MKKENVGGRRNILKVAGAGLVAAVVPSVTAAAMGEQTAGEEIGSHPKPIYLSGCGWNRDLPGVFGEVCLTFDVRAEVGGTGLGTFRDDVHSEVNSQFEIKRVTKHGKEYTLEGEIIASRDSSLLGMAVKIVAEDLGKGQGKASITVGDPDSLVVIAIIAILIGTLVPAIQ